MGIMEKIKITTKKIISGEEVSSKDFGDALSYFRHIPNSRKSEEEFQAYCIMAKKRGFPNPNRNSYVRPLHEKYDELGNLVYPLLDKR